MTNTQDVIVRKLLENISSLHRLIDTPVGPVEVWVSNMLKPDEVWFVGGTAGKIVVVRTEQGIDDKDEQGE